MTRFALYSMLLIQVVQCGRVTAQAPGASFDLGRSPIPTAAELVEQIGTEEDARIVLLTVLERELSRPLSWRMDPVRLVAAQVRTGWVPWNTVINVVRLDDDAARAAYRDCAYLLVFHPASRDEGALVVSIASQNRCEGEVRHYRFRRTSTGWVADPKPSAEGWGMTHCGCS